MSDILPTLYEEDGRKTFEQVSRREACQRCFATGRTVIKGSPNYWIAYRVCYNLAVRSGGVYWRPTQKFTCTFKEGRIYGNILALKRTLIDCLHLDWLKQEDWCEKILGERKYLWQEVLKGNITNPEVLCKKFSKRYFRGVYSYNTIKSAARKNYGLLLRFWTLYEYTTNPELAVKKLLCDDNEWSSLFNDCLEYARIQDIKINPSWSLNRLRNEHQKQIEREKFEEIEKCSNKDVITPYQAEGLSLITNERDACQESELMHNCVYRCYWRDVRNHQYLVAKGEVNGCYINLGIAVHWGNLLFDQVFASYNRSVDKSVQDWCENWIDRHRETLLDIITEPKELPEETPF